MPDDIRTDVDSAIGLGLQPAVRSDKAKLALAARILAANGHATGLAGQLTVRAEPDGWWTLPLGAGFEEASEETLLRVDARTSGRSRAKASPIRPCASMSGSTGPGRTCIASSTHTRRRPRPCR